MNALELRRRTLGKGVYKKTVEGNPAIAQGSLARRYPGITMQGWTEQDGTEGNQLFDASVFDGMEQSGVSVSATDGVITASGMSETAIWIQAAKMTEEDFKKFKSGNIYVKNYKTADCNYEAGIYINSTAVKEGNSPYTIPDGYFETNPNNVYFFIDVRAGVELKGSIQTIVYQDGDGTWEPYTGGQPSPNPDYPQEIVSAGKHDEATGKYQYEVKLTGANLFNPEKLTGGEIVEYNGVQCYKYTDNSTNFTYVDDFAENTQYCFSVMVLSSEGNEEKATNMSIVYTDGTRSTIYLSYNQLMNVVSSANKTVAMITGNDSWSVARYIDLTMTTLGIGTEPLPYQPYKEQTVTLTSDRPLTKWDKLTKKNGVWGWEYGSAEIVFDGSEAWDLTGATSDEYQGFALKSSDYNAMKSNLRLVCDKFAYSTSDKINTCRQEKSEYGLRFVVSTEYVPNKTVAEFKNWLQSNPITVLYHLAEPVFAPLSETEQEQMNELYTFRPTTVLSNDCECEMTLTYKTKKSLEVTT